MQVLEIEKLPQSTVEGVNGPMNLFTALREQNLTFQLVMVPPHTRAPKLGTPITEKMFVLVLEGSATFTNGEYYEKIVTGRMVVLEAGEMRAYQTEKDRLIALEVRYPTTQKPVTPVQVAMPMPEPVAEAPRRSSVTFEV